MATSASPEQETSGRRRWLMLAGLSIAAVLLFVLGTWQVQRLAWKQNLIAQVEARLAAAPVTAPGRKHWPSISAADEYLRVAVSGTLLHDKAVTVAAATERGQGYWVLTPLKQDDGTTVIVNRGFVTSERRDPARRRADNVPSLTTIVGLLRITEADAWILRRNDPAAGRWYRRDPAEIAAASGLQDVAPYFIDADATPNPSGWPIGGMTRVSFSNNHLVYALTWYALAAFAVAAFIYVLSADFLRQRSS